MRTKTPTRERLLAAAIELMRTEGSSAVTTQRLTKAVGIVQSGFYRHFNSAEACLLCAATTTAAMLRSAVANNRMQHKLAQQDDATELTSHLVKMFDMCRKNWAFVELTMAYRHQKSEFGRVLAKAWRNMEQDVASHLDIVFSRLKIQIEPSHLQRIAVSVHAIIIRVGERERTKTSQERKVAAHQVAKMINALCESARMGDS